MVDDVPQDVWEYANRTLTGQEHLFIGGTEYDTLEDYGFVVVRLVDSTNNPVENAECLLRVFYSNTTMYFEENMTHYPTPSGGAGGIYYINFLLADQVGVFPYGVDCAVSGSPSPKNYYLLDTYHVKNSTETLLSAINYSISIQINQTLEGIQQLNESLFEDIATHLSFSGGTEYIPGDEVMLVVQFFTGNVPLNNESTYVTVFDSDWNEIYSDVNMTFKEDGIYYFGFTAPWEPLGVYTASAYAVKGAKTYYASHTFHINKGLGAILVR
jgi:hypothetical protein